MANFRADSKRVQTYMVYSWSSLINHLIHTMNLSFLRPLTRPRIKKSPPVLSAFIYLCLLLLILGGNTCQTAHAKAIPAQPFTRSFTHKWAPSKGAHGGSQPSPYYPQHHRQLKTGAKAKSPLRLNEHHHRTANLKTHQINQRLHPSQGHPAYNTPSPRQQAETQATYPEPEKPSITTEDLNKVIGTKINRLFPLEQYPQNLHLWFNPQDQDYNTPLLDRNIQLSYTNLLYKNYYGKNSPWSKTYVEFLFHPEPKTHKSIYKGEKAILAIYRRSLAIFNVKDDSLFAFNYHSISPEWLDAIEEKINVNQFKNLKYQETHRYISVTNIIVRSLPTKTPLFNNFATAGSGYPFDLLNLGIIPAATPIYVVGYSRHKDWCLVIAPTIMGWIPSNLIAYTPPSFVESWRKYIKKSVASITTNHIPIVDTAGTFRFEALTGTLIPIREFKKNSYRLLIPIKTSGNQAAFAHVIVDKNDASLLPLPLTKRNYARLLTSLLGGAYGWGGYNFNFDCSLEMQFLYRNFGILLPRSSAPQATYGGSMSDYSRFSATERLNLVRRYAKPLITLIYVPGHIMSYLGTYKSTVYGRDTIMFYNNIWGLSPKDKSWRSVIGESVILPLLQSYKQVPDAMSLLLKKRFILTTLDHPKNMKLGLSSLLY